MFIQYLIFLFDYTILNVWLLKKVFVRILHGYKLFPDVDCYHWFYFKVNWEKCERLFSDKDNPFDLDIDIQDIAYF